MIIDATSNRLIVISDLHLGSPVSTAQKRLPKFLDHVAASGADLCINGDGVDLMHGSISRLIGATLPFLRRVGKLQSAGGRVFYLLGNHDISLEHVLADMPMVVAPFLNVVSGDQRIRVEHGHVYEPFYAKHPDLYELGGRMALPLLLARKDIYRLYSSMQAAVDRRRRAGTAGYPHYLAADALHRRGFDAVVLGHTHHPEHTQLERGLFVNSGSWMEGGAWVDINAGRVTLHAWPDLPR